MSKTFGHDSFKQKMNKDFIHQDFNEKTTKKDKKYKSILDFIDDGYFEVDLSGSFTFINDYLCKLIGYEKNEMLGMNYKEYMTKETARKVFRIFNNVYKTGEKAKLYDWEISGKSGLKHTHESSVSLIKDEDGKPIGFRGIVRDITERRRTEEALRKSEEKYRKILENMDDIYAEFDLTGRAVFRNRAASEMLGSKNTGQSYKEYTTPEMQKKLFKIFNNVYKTGKPATIDEYELRSNDGKTITLEGKVNLNRDEFGNPTGFSLLAHDISERKRAELEQRKLESQLQHAQRMEAIGTLAGGIAHDFNNLLMSIQGNASTMIYKLDPYHPHYDRLKNIINQIESGSDLTRQLLGFSRSGKYEIKVTDMNVFISQMVRMFSSTKKELNIKERYEENIWTVEIDRGQINQAVLNLFVNACQAMDDGGDLYIRTENVVLDGAYVKSYGVKPGGFVKISVTDTGIGMDPETLERVFDPFFTTKDVGRGIGLGLASTYGIVNNHGGIINAYSEKGLGSTFNIYLPVSEKKILEEIETQRDMLTGSETILFVDDEERIIEAGRDMLELLGYKIIFARNGNEAVKIYTENKNSIDMVILDMIMPGMDGGEVFDRIKMINPNVKALLSSGYSINGKASKIIEKGCKGFIQKPFTIDQISKKVREILDKN